MTRRIGLLIGALGLCAICVTVALMYLKCRHDLDLANFTDVRSGLTCFMEQHQGRFPSSEHEFVESPFVERLANGAIRISCRPTYPFPGYIYGRPIRDLARFRVRWGTDIFTLVMDQDGVVRDAVGNEVLLLQWGCPDETDRADTRHLFEASRQARAQGEP